MRCSAPDLISLSEQGVTGQSLLHKGLQYNAIAYLDVVTGRKLTLFVLSFFAVPCKMASYEKDVKDISPDGPRESRLGGDVAVGINDESTLPKGTIDPVYEAKARVLNRAVGGL